jgi:hypothetical protein
MQEIAVRQNNEEAQEDILPPAEGTFAPEWTKEDEEILLHGQPGVGFGD